MAVGSVGLTPSEFWDLTPEEFGYIFKAWNSRREEDFQSSWNQTRILSYYIYCSYPKRGRNPSFNKFKKEHLPYSWDRIASDPDENERDPEEVLTINQWKDRIASLQSAKVEIIKDATTLGSI